MKTGLGDIVMKVFGNGEEAGLCEVVSLLDEPSAELIGSDGKAFQWAQSLTRPATPEESMAYWKSQAETWKRRASQHGCDTANGDSECG